MGTKTAQIAILRAVFRYRTGMLSVCQEFALLFIIFHLRIEHSPPTVYNRFGEGISSLPVVGFAPRRPYN